MNKPKIWLCGITNAGNKQNLEGMIAPILQYFDGLVFTFHYPTDEGAQYLEENKKEGKIIYAEWCQRHGYSQNHFLYQGPMRADDFFVLLDSPERISPEFCSEHLPKLIAKMQESAIGVLANFGKPFLFRYSEILEFKGSPHWFVSQTEGHTANLELPKNLFWSVRGETRNEWHFINHYAKYYIDYPAGSNHCLLGLEKNGDPQKLFPIREMRRLKFRDVLRERGIEQKLEAVIEYFKAHKPLDDEFKEFVNNEKILNDLYRYHVLGDFSMKDNHDFKDMIKL